MGGRCEVLSTRPGRLLILVVSHFYHKMYLVIFESS